MNIRDLVSKLDTIAEADSTGRIDYKANQAQDAKEAAIAQVKQMASTPLNNIPRFGVAINPKTGQIFYGDAGNDSGTISPKGYPYKWMMPGGPAESVRDGDRIRASGLEIVDKNGYAYVDAGKLSTIDQPTTPTAPTGDQGTKPQYLNIDKNAAAKFILLVNKVEQAKASDTTTPATTTPASTTTTPTTGQDTKPGKNLLPVDPKVQAMQKAIQDAAKAAGQPDPLPVHGADGRMGPETQKAMAKYPQVKSVQESFSLGIDNALLESFGYQIDEVTADQAWDVTKAVGKELAPTLGVGAAIQGGAKMLGKHIPGVNLAFAGKDAYDRLKSGDYTGAGISALSAGAGLIPGIGTAASLGLDAANIARDYKHGDYDELAALFGKDTPKQEPASQSTKPTATATVPPGGDPKVFAIQKQLIAKGAKNIDGTPLVADGKMGKNTQAAMAAFKMAMPQESVAESIAGLRDRLMRLDEKGFITGSAKVAADELEKGAKTAATVAKDAGAGLRVGNIISAPNGQQVKIAVDKTGTWALIDAKTGQNVKDDVKHELLKQYPALKPRMPEMSAHLEKKFGTAAATTPVQSASASSVKAGANAADEWAKAEQEVLKASNAGNKEATSILQQIKASGSTLEAWAKANPKKLWALAAAIPAIAYLATSGENKPADDTGGGGGGGGGTVVAPHDSGQDQKPTEDPNAADMATLKALYDQFIAAKGEGGNQDFEPQLADAIKRYEAMVGKGDAGQGGKPQGPVDATGKKLAYDVGTTRSYTGSSENPNWSAAAPVKESDELSRWLKIARG